MKKTILAFLLLVSAQSFAQYTLQHMKPLTGLLGSWESERKKGTLIELWQVKNDSTMLGYSYIKTATDSIPEENVELVLREGKIRYIARASRQNDEQPVPFTLSKIEDGKYIFENRAHDFPQQITYQLIDKNTLHAAIAGPMNGKDVHIDFHFKRSSSK